MTNSTFIIWLLAILFGCAFFGIASQEMVPSPIVSEEVGPSEQVTAIAVTAEGPMTTAPDEISIEGTVVEHVYDCAFDGFCYVIVQTDTGETYDVIYAPGMMRCENTNLGTEVSDIEAGERVEAFGEIFGEGQILVCNSNSYYLNTLNQ